MRGDLPATPLSLPDCLSPRSGTAPLPLRRNESATVGEETGETGVPIPDRFMEEVSQCPGVKFVERDIPVYALDMPAYVPDDQRYAEQWGPEMIGAEYAWNIE